MAPPSQDPYLFPHLYMQDNLSSTSSSEIFYEASPDLQPQRDPDAYQYYSDDNSQNHTNPPPDFSNYSLGPNSDQESSVMRQVSPPPGRRFGLTLDSKAILHGCPISGNLDLELNLNLPPPNVMNPVGREPPVSHNPFLNAPRPSGISVDPVGPKMNDPPTT